MSTYTTLKYFEEDDPGPDCVWDQKRNYSTELQAEQDLSYATAITIAQRLETAHKNRREMRQLWRHYF